MRRWLPATLLIVLGVASCAGSSTMLATQPQPAPVAGLNNDTAQPQDAALPGAAALANLAAPREISTGDSVLTVAPGTRSYLTSTAVYIIDLGPGVTQEGPDFLLRFDPSQAGQLTHTFFIIDRQPEPSITLAEVSLDIDWLDGAPDGPTQGFYVGVPDYARNTWEWRGPARSAGDILDYSDRALAGNFEEWGRDVIALVNFSDRAAKVRYFNFTTSNPSDTNGDEWLFYVMRGQHADSVYRAASNDLDHPQLLFSSEPDAQFSDIFVRTLDGEPHLVVNKYTSDGHSQVWQAGLDGSGLSQVNSGAGDLRYCGQSWDGLHEAYAEGALDGTGTLRRYSNGVAVADLSRALPGELKATPRWYGTSGYDISVVAPGTSDQGQATLMAFLVSEQFDAMHFVPAIYGTTVTDGTDPVFFKWANGLFGNHQVMLYSGRKSLADNYQIRINLLGASADQNNWVFVDDGGMDLRYPSMSPDNRLLTCVACAPGTSQGQLYVQSSFLRGLDPTAAVADNVVGTPAWYDPTLVPIEE